LPQGVREGAGLAQRDAAFLRQPRHHLRQLLGQVRQKRFDILLLELLDPIAHQVGFTELLHEIIERGQAFGECRYLLLSAIPGTVNLTGLLVHPLTDVA
jgi:hypothetical protein